MRLKQSTRTIAVTKTVSPCGEVWFLCDLAPDGVCPAASVTVSAVCSYHTVSPLPRQAWRFVFCGTVPKVALAGRYPASFRLEPGLSSPSLASGSGHPAVWSDDTSRTSLDY